MSQGEVAVVAEPVDEKVKAEIEASYSVSNILETIDECLKENEKGIIRLRIDMRWYARRYTEMSREVATGKDGSPDKKEAAKSVEALNVAAQNVTNQKTKIQNAENFHAFLLGVKQEAESGHIEMFSMGL